MKCRFPSRVPITGIMAIASAWSAGCGNIEINGPDWDWSDWPWVDDQAGHVSVTSEWRGGIAPGHRIEIKGVSGTIHAARSPGTEVVVVAVKTGRPAAVDGVSIEVVAHENGVTICAVYPDVPRQAPNSCEPGDAGHLSASDHGRGLARVTFTVQLPAGVSLVARTMAGDIEATNLRSDAFLTTLAGNITVSTTRLATARTTNGSIVASLGLSAWGRDLEFTTLNGDVDVTIPFSTNANVWATSQYGQVVSDFSLQVVQPGELRGTIGSGGPTLRLSTLAGVITLHGGLTATAGAARVARSE